MAVTNWGTIPIKPAAFFAALAGEAQSRSQLPFENVFLSLAPDEYHLKFPPADNFVSIFPAALPVWQEVVSGGGQPELLAGSAHVGFNAQVVFTWFNRLTGDQEFRAGEQITSQSLGILAQITVLLGGLQFWECPHADDVTTSPLREYMRVVDGPRISPRVYQTGNWALAKTTFEAKFSADLT